MTAKANLTWITDDLATGGDLSFNDYVAADQVEDIVAQGVTHIIDMRSEAADFDLWKRRGVNYLRLPTTDAHGHHIPEDLFHEGVKFARKAAAAGGKVFAHCHMGINRGPSMAYAILLDRGYGVREAFSLIRSKRDVAAIMYAEDALDAHHARRLAEGNLGFDRHREKADLKMYIDLIWTPEERARISRIIRRNHEEDYEVITALQKQR